MNIINVLLDSLKLLKRRPQLFVPKLTSALISSAWALFMLQLVRTGQFQALTATYALTMPFIILLGVFVPLMTAEMIRNRDREALLSTSFVRTFEEWKKVLAMTLMMFVLIMVTASPAVIGFMAFFTSGLPLFAGIGIALSLGLMLVVGFLIYFLPISVLEENTFTTGIKEAVRTSIGNRREVSLLMVFSFGMFGIAAISQGTLRNLGSAFFIIGRLLSATVTTYTFVISPNYYLKEKEAEESKEDSETEKTEETEEESSEEKE